ncbi:hypothetical protein [Flavobacterium quisquiliarum]|uniref:Uncharacterized protein n=1 Tax=Flavobacterium quisquiliarum TaxID=1834436 RepID=A0ABV8WEK0_9FLAO|nr:hypothetical protein [Flavobacterium quisquiliarum]MBW1657945.1 hypothetical protein [Flavobacterium quisquiliarum]NWL01002.1 hypothetical protein [Flavobacterium collinsii]
METQNNMLKEDQENGSFGIFALVLIIINACCLHGLLMSLNQENSFIKKLWIPNQLISILAVPTFIFICLITIWIIAPAKTQMKQIFKIAGIIGIVLYLLCLLFIIYVIGMARAWNH